MVPPHVKKHLPLLEYLAKSNPKIQKAIVSESDPEVIDIICECANSVLKGGVPLSSTQSKKLKRYRKKLHELTKKNTSVKRKKKILSGGFLLGSLLGSLIPGVVGAIGSLFNSK